MLYYATSCHILSADPFTVIDEGKGKGRPFGETACRPEPGAQHVFGSTKTYKNVRRILGFGIIWVFHGVPFDLD
jgi:hypothetical protein